MGHRGQGWAHNNTVAQHVVLFQGASESAAPADLEKAADLVAQVKQILGWTANAGFPDQSGLLPPAPALDPPSLEQLPGQ